MGGGGGAGWWSAGVVWAEMTLQARLTEKVCTFGGD